MEGAPMLIPLWFAGIVAAAIVAQFFGGIAWLIRADKARAVSDERMQGALSRLSEKVDTLAATLERHNPIAVQAQIDGIVQRVASVESGAKAHHKLIRGLQRRMDRAHFPEEPTEGGNGDA